MDVVLKNNPNVDMFDINLGCPAPKVTKTGAGSALLKDPQKLEEMFKIICKHSPIPVTAKIRLGWNEETINFKENIKALENAGISAIGLHARTTRAGYAGNPRWDLVKNLRDEMSVPLIVSGDIYDVSDAINALEITHADAIMVARGGVGNPKLIERINSYFNDGTLLPRQTIKESKDYLLKFAEMLIEEKGEYSAMMVLRGIAPKFFLNLPNTKQIRCRLASALATKESLLRILDEIKEE
jgi:nifR3 family TIM-barrel protein